MENKNTPLTEEHKDGHVVSYQMNILVWIDLLIFTLVTIRIAFFDLQNLTVVMALLIASVKTWLVGTYFMHLKFESRFFRYMAIMVAIVFVAVLIILFSDYFFR
jgi:cytochrome c oxidase subunit IV